jgi:hypothetical protein
MPALWFLSMIPIGDDCGIVVGDAGKVLKDTPDRHALESSPYLRHPSLHLDEHLSPARSGSPDLSHAAVNESASGENEELSDWLPDQWKIRRQGLLIVAFRSGRRVHKAHIQAFSFECFWEFLGLERRIDEPVANLLHLTARAAYAASRISSNLKGTTKQFGWLQASATKVSSLSITSANPATIRICNAAVEIRESCV